ncbi:conserved hypothetical protein [Synechococcus sp. PCC 7335]|uniref:tRNA (5-methylaminomethyl-2-thiouridine)(34)-methyltransferase MnmD n=1 Tax=Synechococcus sp. (strain ATCC 29403 / PCC 7335) TaxID=91464 RepID=UPI00017ECAAF|nr:MnmC family methyltransferase [Synechococcus sp. PCC 7335]EDX83842.1 conserved hypothetical protein [Synechococcus sp. PCC 7335]
MFTPVRTEDGSNTFYSDEFDEWFHSRAGAYNEAQKTYVEASNIAGRARQNSLSILDVCYGLGYNTAAALETIWGVNPQCFVNLRALEIDVEVARSAIAQNLTQNYSPLAQVLEDLAAHYSAKRATLYAQLVLGDARQQIQTLVNQAWQADTIFLDPFSPPHCPQLWTLEFLTLVAQCLDPNDGVLVTYSCAAAVRSALQSIGLTIRSTDAGSRKWPGTIASFSPAALPLSSRQLSKQEQEHLQTKAAVPYRDPSLTSTASEILARRTQQQLDSDLIPTGPWRKRWAAFKQ